MEITFRGIAGYDFAMEAMRAARSSYEKSDEERDSRLADNLIHKATDSHAKFSRMIVAYFTVNASMTFWKQFDTYRIGLEKSSESTMFQFYRKDHAFSAEDFHEGYLFIKSKGNLKPSPICESDPYKEIAPVETFLRWLSTQPPEVKAYWTPMAFKQTRYCMASYQTLRRIYKERKNHKIDEWKFFCKALESFPHKELII